MRSLLAPAGCFAFALALIHCSSAPTQELTSRTQTQTKSDGGSKANSNASNSATDDDGGTPIVDAPDTELQVLPFATYSGYDGTHSFKVPVAVYGAGSDLTLSASDPSAVTITKVSLQDPGNDLGSWFFVETKKAAKIKLTASSGGKTADTSLTIASYDPSSYDTGATRYMNVGSNGTDPPCTQCHGGQNGIDHSPATMASSTDSDIKTIITTGVIDEHPITQVVHKWQVSADELTGLVTYLRALEPKGFTQ